MATRADEHGGRAIGRFADTSSERVVSVAVCSDGALACAWAHRDLRHHVVEVMGEGASLAVVAEVAIGVVGLGQLVGGQRVVVRVDRDDLVDGGEGAYSLVKEG